MQTEIEAKWLNINPAALRATLEESGAKLVSPERVMIRRNFDYPDKRLEKVGGWVRVRDEGNKVTLSYKQVNDRTIQGTKEVSVAVDNFDLTCSFLEAIGLKQISIQETKRESWELNGAQIEIDTWPWIPTFVEIEAANEETVYKAAHTLQLSADKALHGSVEVAYLAMYDVTEKEIDNWAEIRFIPIPDWLKNKQKSARG